MNASAPTLTRPGLAWLAGGLAAGFLAASLLGPALGPARAQSGSDEPTRQINVTGTGRIFATPDVADVQLGVTFQADSAKGAADLAANTMDAVIKSLLDLGIPEADIQTTQLTLNPVYDYNNTPPKIEGWEATNIVSVTVRDVTAVGDVVDAATAAGATNVQGITFRVEDPTVAEAQARSAAVADAEAKATQLAADAGVNIVGVLNITDNSFNAPQPLYMERAFSMAEGADVAATPVLPGNVELSVSVSIAYEIE